MKIRNFALATSFIIFVYQLTFILFQVSFFVIVLVFNFSNPDFRLI